jgi:hypothetical protein
MIYDTPHGSVSILSQNVQKAAVQVTDDSTIVTLFEGAITLRGDNMAGGEALQPGQQAVIRKRGVDQPPEITIAPIPQEQKEKLENMVNSACQARKKVYFDVAERQNEIENASSELQPRILIPDPRKIGPIVSPARP